MDELTPEGVGRPHCPDPGHEAHRVVRDGFRGKEPAKRQRFRCVNPADRADWHRFSLPVQRVVAPQHRCEGCAQLVPLHVGPVVPGGYHYLASVVAGALVDVATGDTFQQASARARAALALTVGAPGGDFSNHRSLHLPPRVHDRALLPRPVLRSAVRRLPRQPVARERPDRGQHASRGVVDTACDFAGGHSPGTEQFATAQIRPT